MDLGAALGAGGPGGPGGPPPGLGGPPGLPPDAGVPPDAGAPPGPDDATGGLTNSLEALQAAEDALKAFIQLDPDHADRAVAAQCLQNVLKLQASNQDSAQSGDAKSLARALQQGPAGTGGPGGAGY
jgi:hypothetical protein